MTLTPGTRLGPYEVTAQIGVGGMGEVYRAHDAKLHRDVAIKVLLPAVANDPDRRARFSREAQVLASLNHPNIAAIYGLEESEGTLALVMELVEGPTLADRIAHAASPKPHASGLSLDEALPIAKQIAEALEAAHEQGIIHRDLKPANIKVRPDGTVKVLDFGLAKAMDPAGASSDHAMNSPTISLHATQAGMILGTAAYMAPEQARGATVDKRADLWAFGVVLYEMLTGTRLFEGVTISDTLAAVLKTEPDWTRLPADTPTPIRRLLRRCLEKERKKRLPDAADIRLEIEDALTAPAADASSAGVAVSPSSVRGTRLAWAVAAIAVLGVAVLALPAVRYLREAPPDAPPETRVDLVTPAGGDPLAFALSPDGRQLVFVAAGDGASRLWLRSLSTTTAQPLAGTEGAQFPFWAPDSRAVAFFADSQLKRLDLGGGAPRALATALLGRGGSWNADGVVLFAPIIDSPLFRVAAAGGDAAPVTTLDRQDSHRFPVFLPDGQHFLFYAAGGPDTGGIHLGALEGGAPTRLTAADTAGTYLPAGAGRDGGPGGAEALREGGWLLWTRAGTLQAQRLDLARRALTGDPVTLADAVAYDGIGRSAVAVSATGLVAYRAGRASRRQLTWVDRTGTVLGTLGAPDEHSLFGPRVAPDGRRVAVQRTVQDNTDLWLLDGARTSRVTFDAGGDRIPIWSPDGRRLVFESDRTGVQDLYGKDASGAGVEARLVASAQPKVATDWSADGRFLLYFSLDPQTDGDLWAQEMDPSTGAARAGRAPGTVLRTPFTELWGRFSPDGRWVAYQSNASGRPEIYVRPWTPPAALGAAAPAPSAQWQVSTAGGISPSWRADGQALYYLGPDGALMAAPVTTRGTALEPGTPVALFPTRIVYGGGDGGLLAPQYDVTRDGRFLINTVLDDAAATPITLIQHWRPEGKR